MSEKYLLISFVRLGVGQWHVYGHVNNYTNTHLATLKTQSQAMEYAHDVAAGWIPVIQGSAYHGLINILAAQENSDESID